MYFTHRDFLQNKVALLTLPQQCEMCWVLTERPVRQAFLSLWYLQKKRKKKK